MHSFMGIHRIVKCCDVPEVFEPDIIVSHFHVLCTWLVIYLVLCFCAVQNLITLEYFQTRVGC